MRTPRQLPFSYSGHSSCTLQYSPGPWPTTQVPTVLRIEMRASGSSRERGGGEGAAAAARACCLKDARPWQLRLHPTCGCFYKLGVLCVGFLIITKALDFDKLPFRATS